MIKKNQLFRVGATALLAGSLLALGTGMAKRPRGPVSFPKDFYWGAASAAMQSEGGNENNNWAEWAALGKTKDLPGRAVDFWNRYDQDFALARQLNLNAFRMSVEWSRIEPSPGVYSEEAIQHYRQILSAAHARGLTTFVTIMHFTTPLWASHQGGWTNPEIPAWLERFTTQVAARLGDQIDYWITLNEPNVQMLTGYVAGVSPPGEQDLQHAILMYSNLIKAHGRAYHVIHDFFPDAKVGFAHHMRVFQPAQWWNPLDRIVAGFADRFWNTQILDAMTTGRLLLSIPFVAHHDEQLPWLAHTLDFVGVNYYTRNKIHFNLSSPTKFELAPPDPSGSYGDTGDEVYPEGFYQTLLVASSYGKPVYVTENGMVDAADVRRKRYICDHLLQLNYALQDGADVRGYIHWSLTDNWEWIYGFGPRCGLVWIDYSDLSRTVRPSGRLLSEIIQSNSLKACESL
jgi:beta-glucosidase